MAQPQQAPVQAPMAQPAPQQPQMQPQPAPPPMQAPAMPQQGFDGPQTRSMEEDSLHYGMSGFGNAQNGMPDVNGGNQQQGNIPSIFRNVFSGNQRQPAEQPMQSPQGGGDSRLQMAFQLMNSPYANPGMKFYAKQIIDQHFAQNAPMSREQQLAREKFDADQQYRQDRLEFDKSNVSKPKRQMVKGADGRQHFVDTGNLVLPDVETPEPSIKTDRFETEQKLRKEYGGINTVKAFREQSQAYQRVLKSASNPSAAGDLALIFNYMKVLDPGSVVRESEFATAAASGSLGERIRAAVGKIQAGHRLSPEMRKDFVARAGELYKGAVDLHGNANDRYSGLSKQYGIDPSRIIFNAPEIGVLDPEYNPNDSQWQDTGGNSQTGAPEIGAIVDSHRYKGGNPADQNSWERVQ